MITMVGSVGGARGGDADGVHLNLASKKDSFFPDSIQYAKLGVFEFFATDTSDNSQTCREKENAP